MTRRQSKPLDGLDVWAMSFGGDREALRWDAWLAMWLRIGKDFAVGWVYWAATGDAFRGHDFGPPVDADTRDAARAALKQAGFVPPED